MPFVETAGVGEMRCYLNQTLIFLKMKWDLNLIFFKKTSESLLIMY